MNITCFTLRHMIDVKGILPIKRSDLKLISYETLFVLFIFIFCFHFISCIHSFIHRKTNQIQFFFEAQNDETRFHEVDRIESQENRTKDGKNDRLS